MLRESTGRSSNEDARPNVHGPSQKSPAPARALVLFHGKSEGRLFAKSLFSLTAGCPLGYGTFWDLQRCRFSFLGQHIALKKKTLNPCLSRAGSATTTETSVPGSLATQGHHLSGKSDLFVADSFQE